MSDDKRVKLIGEVEIDQSTTEGALLAMVAELKKWRDGWEKGTAQVGKAEKGIKEVSAETKRAKELTEIWKGIWQGIGQGLFKSAVNGVRGLVGAIAGGIDTANEFGDIFDRMAARGVENIDTLKESVRDLANELGTDTLETAKVVDLADLLGGGVGAIDTARAALINFNLTGADYNMAIRESNQLTRAFNLGHDQQADVLAKVALSARRASVEQSELYSSIVKLAPQANNLGITLDDLLEVTEAGLKKGIQPIRMGLMGMSEVMEQIAQPTEEFTKALVENRIVTTASSAEYLRHGGAVAVLKGELAAVNAELRTQQELTSQIERTNNQAQRRIERFEQLTKKQQESGRLNRLERAELGDLEKSLERYNEKLSQYDKQARFVKDSEFRRLDVLGQLKIRIQNAALVQGEMQESSVELEARSRSLTAELGSQETELKRLADVLAIEVPAAIQQAIGEQGLTMFLSKLTNSVDMMTQMSSVSQTFLRSVSGDAAGLGDAGDRGAAGLASLRGEMDGLVERSYDAYEKLRARFTNLKTLLLEPLAGARDEFAREFNGLFSEERLNKVRMWTEQLGVTLISGTKGLAQAMVADIDAGLNEEKTWGEIFGGWIDAGWDFVVQKISDLMQPLVESAIYGLESREGQLSEGLTRVMLRVLEGLGAAVADKAFAIFNPLMDYWYAIDGLSFAPGGGGNLGTGGNFVSGGAASGDFGAPNVQQRSSGSNSSSTTFSNSFQINGAGDPDAVADLAIQRMYQAERLGQTGARR